MRPGAALRQRSSRATRRPRCWRRSPRREAWRASADPAALAGVALTDDGAHRVAAGTSLHPLGSLQVRERILPLAIQIDRFAGARLPPQTWTIIEARLRAGQNSVQTTTLEDWFALGQFVDLTAETQLSGSGYHQFQSGVTLIGGGLDVADQRPAEIDWDTTLIGDGVAVLDQQPAPWSGMDDVQSLPLDRPFAVADWGSAPDGRIEVLPEQPATVALTSPVAASGLRELAAPERAGRQCCDRAGLGGSLGARRAHGVGGGDVGAVGMITLRFSSYARPVSHAAIGPTGAVTPELVMNVDNATGTRTVTGPALSLVGPEAVASVDPGLFGRRYPAAGVTDAPDSALACVEVLAEDLPWRFTPGAAGPVPLPWLVLVVLEAARNPVSEARPNPVVHAQVAELPDLAQSWAWAHLQAGDGATIARLLCPRRLAADTSYARGGRPRLSRRRRRRAGPGPVGRYQPGARLEHHRPG